MLGRRAFLDLYHLQGVEASGIFKIQSFLGAKKIGLDLEKYRSHCLNRHSSRFLFVAFLKLKRQCRLNLSLTETCQAFFRYLNTIGVAPRCDALTKRYKLLFLNGYTVSH